MRRPTYLPPRRESIADHLNVIARRSRLLGIRWSPKLNSQRFVVDLIERKIINGPAAVAKAVGPGCARRFSPRDYRDLLVVLKLKSQSVGRPSAWIVALWLRGHDYDLDLVRASLIREVRVIVIVAKRDIAPSGRWTDVFSVKYDRRVRQRPEGNVISECVDLLEPLAALMIRPSESPTDVINARRLGVSLAACIAGDDIAISTAIQEITERMATGEALSERSSVTLKRLVNESLPVPVIALLSTPRKGTAPLLNMDTVVAGLRGMYDDGTGHSQLLDSLDKCANDDLVAARSIYQTMYLGHYKVADILCTDVKGDDRSFLDWIVSGLRFQSRLALTNPSLVPLLYGIVVAETWLSRRTSSDKSKSEEADRGEL